jgi:hypothetical protein
MSPHLKTRPTIKSLDRRLTARAVETAAAVEIEIGGFATFY